MGCDWMLKRAIALSVATLCIVILCVSLFAYWRSLHRITPDQVVKISAPGGQLDAEETEQFLKLFNAAKYKGKDIEYGTTSDAGFSVYLQNETIIRIEAYGNDSFWVHPVIAGHHVKDDSYYIESKELYAFFTDRYMTE